MTCSVHTLLAEPRPRTPHVCHGHHDDDAHLEWRRGLTELIGRVDRASAALADAFAQPRDGLLHPEQCIRHFRTAAAQIRQLTTCPCAIDEPGSLLAVGGALARARASATACGGRTLAEDERAALCVEMAELRSEMLAAVAATCISRRGHSAPHAV